MGHVQYNLMVFPSLPKFLNDQISNRQYQDHDQRDHIKYWSNATTSYLASLKH